MNKFFKATTALLTLSVLVACGEDAAMDESLNLSNGKTLERISITGKDFQIDGATRSSVVVDNAGVNFLWAANDTVGIFPNSGSQAEFAMEEGVGMQTATFNGGGWALKHSATYSAYYPYNFYNRDLTRIPVKYEGQMQDGNAATSHLGAYDYMAASVTTPSNGAVAFDMQHMGALVMLQTNLDEAKTLTSVALKANADVFTTVGTMDLSVVNPAIATTSATNTLTIALSNFTVAASETSTIYFMMAPTNLLGETLEVTLSDEKGAYIKYEVAGKNFVAGTAYAYTLTEGEKFDAFITYNAVDLDLPSGTLWADRNVGADSPEACGDYFAWGETEPKDGGYHWDSYKWTDRSNGILTKYFTDSSYGTVDNKTTLDLEDDAAYVNMGSEWRMPTTTEQRELMDNCTCIWTTQNGVNGYKVTGKNGNSIFLPAAGRRDLISLPSVGSYGYYWSSSLDESDPFFACELNFLSDAYYWSRNFRYFGYSVRAVVR
ncbi:MAG: fimbrillin family protein [Bacteroidaceae bacterium]|nr:fimbrillin family protein [Bacteroidaceae bacterium]